jgi:hypothetical protein
MTLLIKLKQVAGEADWADTVDISVTQAGEGLYTVKVVSPEAVTVTSLISGIDVDGRDCAYITFSNLKGKNAPGYSSVSIQVSLPVGEFLVSESHKELRDTVWLDLAFSRKTSRSKVPFVYKRELSEIDFND